jgi:hypothetical protein
VEAELDRRLGRPGARMPADPALAGAAADLAAGAPGGGAARD